MGRSLARPSARAAAAVDAVALVAFVVVGVIQHDEGLAMSGIVRTGAPLLAAWFAVALVVGAYRRLGWLTLALTWVIAVPIGLLVRSAIRGGPWGRGLLIFGSVAMAFTLAFLVGGRVGLLVASLVRRAREARVEPV